MSFLWMTNMSMTDSHRHVPSIISTFRAFCLAPPNIRSMSITIRTVYSHICYLAITHQHRAQSNARRIVPRLSHDASMTAPRAVGFCPSRRRSTSWYPSHVCINCAMYLASSPCMLRRERNTNLLLLGNHALEEFLERIFEVFDALLLETKEFCSQKLGNLLELALGVIGALLRLRCPFSLTEQGQIP